MIFRHCWECTLEVTPSRRGVVIRMGLHVSIAPTEEARLTALCVSNRALKANVTALWGPEYVLGVAGHAMHAKSAAINWEGA